MLIMEFNEYFELNYTISDSNNKCTVHIYSLEYKLHSPPIILIKEYGTIWEISKFNAKPHKEAIKTRGNIKLTSISPVQTWNLFKQIILKPLKIIQMMIPLNNSSCSKISSSLLDEAPKKGIFKRDSLKPIK